MGKTGISTKTFFFIKEMIQFLLLASSVLVQQSKGIAINEDHHRIRRQAAAVTNIKAIGEVTLDIVIFVEDTQQYIAEAEQLVIALPTAHPDLFAGNFIYLANGANLISFKNDLFEVMNGFVDFTKDSIDKYDDIISNICNNLFQFTLIDQWIDPCAFNKNVWLDYVALLETGMEFIDLNFRLFQLFVSLYIEQFFPNLIS